MLGSRFWSKVKKTLGCWYWTSYITRKGYGQFFSDGRPRSAHRLAYTELVGEIPAGLQLDHKCRNRSCVNPDHLEPVTNKQNQERGIRATQTHCSHGHEYSEENTRWRKQGGRVCRKCHATSTLADYHRNKEFPSGPADG